MRGVRNDVNCGLHSCTLKNEFVKRCNIPIDGGPDTMSDSPPEQSGYRSIIGVVREIAGESKAEDEYRRVTSGREFVCRQAGRRGAGGNQPLASSHKSRRHDHRSRQKNFRRSSERRSRSFRAGGVNIARMVRVFSRYFVNTAERLLGVEPPGPVLTIIA